jgi:adenylate kinase family enzyme
VKRVLIIGSGGAGKSTLAKALAERTGLPLVHLDRHYWRPGWTEPPREEWHTHLRALLDGERWIMDGNYGGTLRLRIPYADTIVFLVFSRWLCIWRVLRRYLMHRNRSRDDMADGCPERLAWAFLVFLWRYPVDGVPRVLELLEAHPGKELHVLRSDREVRRFLMGV